MKKITIIVAFMAIVIGFFGCKKGINSEVQTDQNAIEKFFKVKDEIKPEVKRVYDYLKSKNAEKEFVSNFVKKQGLLDWNKAIVSKKKSTVSVNAEASSVEEPVYVEIPLTTTSEDFAKGFLIAKETSQTLELLLVNGEKYKSLTYGDVNDNVLNAEDLSMKIMIMNKELYGNSDFIINDIKLFDKLLPIDIQEGVADKGGKINIGNIQIQSATSYGRFINTTVYLTYYSWNEHCTHTGSCTSGTCDGCSLCGEWVAHNVPVNVVSYLDDAGSDWEHFDIGNGGGGGGSGTGPNNPCEDNLPMQIFKPCDPNNVGFEIVPEPGVDWTILNGMDEEFIKQETLDNYLKCFKNLTGATYKITISVDQPSPGTRKPYVINNILTKDIDVGHTFLTLEQVSANGEKTIRSLGFYPKDAVDPLHPATNGAIIYDENHEKNVSLTTTIDWAKMNSLVNGIKQNANNIYNLNSNNCTGWAIDRLSGLGIQIPKTIGSWGVGQGANPGDLGEDLRLLSINSNQSKSTSASFAPSNFGTCP